MSRPLRIEYPGAWYHVMNRGAGRRVICPTNAERAYFLALLGDLQNTFGVQTHAYCLMDNHYHLLLHTPRGNLSAAMRYLNGVYTQHHNRYQGKDGALFRGRYKAVLVDVDSYLAQLSRYIHLNPVEARMVRKPEQYRWSSYRAYLGETQVPDWLHVQPTLGLFGQRAAHRHYQAFVNEGLDEELKSYYRKKRLDPVLGGAAFRQRLARRLGKKARDTEIPQRKQLGRRPALNTIMTVTAKAFGVSPKSLTEEGRGRGNLPRAVAMTLARTPGGYPLNTIARAFGVGHYATVSVAGRRLRKRAETDKKLGNHLQRLQKQLFGD